MAKPKGKLHIWSQIEWIVILFIQNAKISSISWENIDACNFLIYRDGEIH